MIASAQSHCQALQPARIRRLQAVIDLKISNGRRLTAEESEYVLTKNLRDN